MLLISQNPLNIYFIHSRESDFQTPSYLGKKKTEPNSPSALYFFAVNVSDRACFYKKHSNPNDVEIQKHFDHGIILMHMQLSDFDLFDVMA